MNRAILVALLAFIAITTAVRADIQYTITDLGTLGGAISEGLGINARGQVAGASTTAGDIVRHAFLWTPATPNGSSGAMTDLGMLGGTDSIGYSINGSGQVTGESDISGAFGHTFLYDGTLHDLGVLGGTLSGGRDINDSGQVAGYSSTAGNATLHAFLWTPATPNGSTGAMTDLGTLGGTLSDAWGINASGQVVGYSHVNGDASANAFLWTPITPNGSTGTMKDLGTLGGTLSVGQKINASGHVSGFSRITGDAPSVHAFLYDGTLHDLGTLGGTQSFGDDINDNGQIVGHSLTSRGASHAFFYASGSGMVDLNTLIDPRSGWELSAAYGINDIGQITGDGVVGGETHAFLLTPVSEPASVTLLLASCSTLSVVICRLRRRGPS